MTQRGSAPGEYRGGRKKNTPNKRTRDLIEILDKANYCAVAELIEVGAIARKEYERSAEVFDAICDQKKKDGVRTPTVDNGPTYLKLMQDSASDLLPYLYPKRKAIELEDPDGVMMNVMTAIFKQIADVK